MIARMEGMRIKPIVKTVAVMKGRILGLVISTTGDGKREISEQ